MRPPETFGLSGGLWRLQSTGRRRRPPTETTNLSLPAIYGNLCGSEAKSLLNSGDKFERYERVPGLDPNVGSQESEAVRERVFRRRD